MGVEVGFKGSGYESWMYVEARDHKLEPRDQSTMHRACKKHIRFQGMLERLKFSTHGSGCNTAQLREPVYHTCLHIILHSFA